MGAERDTEISPNGVSPELVTHERQERGQCPQSSANLQLSHPLFGAVTTVRSQVILHALNRARWGLWNMVPQ